MALLRESLNGDTLPLLGGISLTLSAFSFSCNSYFTVSIFLCITAFTPAIGLAAYAFALAAFFAFSTD